jgi:hypothetical protein
MFVDSDVIFFFHGLNLGKAESWSEELFVSIECWKEYSVEYLFVVGAVFGNFEVYFGVGFEIPIEVSFHDKFRFVQIV